MTENTFHYENLRRRSRYAAVFVIMLSAFLAMIMININTGTVDISAAEIGRIIFAGGKEGTEYRIIWRRFWAERCPYPGSSFRPSFIILLRDPISLGYLQVRR